ncbi:MAG: hypothetical protein PVH62_07485 [Anaerolineae bacterium]|jgi:hypothetical protein
MSQHTLQKLVGTAIVNQRFRRDFLNGGRQRLLAEFDLSPEERAAVLAIRADALKEFAAELENWLESHRRSGMRSSHSKSQSAALADPGWTGALLAQYGGREQQVGS